MISFYLKLFFYLDIPKKASSKLKKPLKLKHFLLTHKWVINKQSFYVLHIMNSNPIILNHDGHTNRSYRREF